MIILFPRDPLNPKQPDDNFVVEESTAKLVGFETFLFDHDEFVRTSLLKTNLPKNYGQLQTIILRGWMLKKEQYLNLHIILIEHGYQLINNTEEYLNCHYFPNAYKHICEHTSKSWWSGEWSGREEANSPENISWGPVRDLLDRSDLMIITNTIHRRTLRDNLLKFVHSLKKLFFRNRIWIFRINSRK
jgi:hypothetical protein